MKGASAILIKELLRRKENMISDYKAFNPLLKNKIVILTYVYIWNHIHIQYTPFNKKPGPLGHTKATSSKFVVTSFLFSGWIHLLSLDIEAHTKDAFATQKILIVSWFCVQECTVAVYSSQTESRVEFK